MNTQTILGIVLIVIGLVEFTIGQRHAAREGYVPLLQFTTPASAEPVDQMPQVPDPPAPAQPLV